MRAGRRRFRCTGCRRTFSDFTGTALAYNKRIDRVAPYCEAILQGRTVRAAAAQCGIHRTTSFRWRHKLLRQLCTQAIPVLTGVVEVVEVRFLYSEKGSRTLNRPAHRRGARGLALDRERHWAVLLRDRMGTTQATATGVRPPTLDQLAALLAPPAAFATELIAPSGPMGTYARFCRRHDIVFHAAGSWHRGTDARRNHHAAASARRLGGWMKRFRGVATRYLDNYLRWHVLVDEANRLGIERIWAAAFRASSGARARGGADPPSARTEHYALETRTHLSPMWKSGS